MLIVLPRKLAPRTSNPTPSGSGDAKPTGGATTEIPIDEQLKKVDAQVAAEVERLKKLAAHEEDELGEEKPRPTSGLIDVWVVERWWTQTPHRYRVTFKEEADAEQVRLKSGSTAVVEGLARPTPVASKTPTKGDAFQLSTAKVIVVRETRLTDENTPRTETPAATNGNKSATSKPTTTLTPSPSTPPVVTKPITPVPSKPSKTDDDDLLEGD
jgi:hypothetical protein